MDIDFVTCPSCRSRNWNDIPKIEDIDKTAFTCNRCDHKIKLAKCGACGARGSWTLLVGIQEKGAHRPMYRFKCGSCGRVIGLLLQPK